MLGPRSMVSQTGQAMSEYLVFLVVLLAAMAGFVYAYSSGASWASRNGGIAAFAAMAAALSWSAKQLVSVVNSRSRLLAMEMLSAADQGLSREELESMLRSQSTTFRLLPGLTLDALAHLFENKSISVNHGRYFVAKPKAARKS